MMPMEQRTESMVDALLQDYKQCRDIDATAPVRHPDKNTMIALTQKLLRIIYPSYSRDGAGDLPALITECLHTLTEQITLVQPEGAAEKALTFFERLPALRAIAQTDVEAAYDGDPAATGCDEIIFCYPGLMAITVYRLAHELQLLKVPMLPRIMTEYAHSITGIDIHPGAAVGKYFFIDHGTGIVIGETTVIGEHVKIYQGVTLGGLSTRGGQSLRGCKRHPTIEDNVTIYANASILGGNTVIGRDSVIGASAFITSSVPPCTTVTNKTQELSMKSRNCGECSKFWEQQGG